jgi:hypothetical protein
MDRLNVRAKIIIILMISMLILAAVQLIPPESSAVTTNELSGGMLSVTSTFDGPGIDPTSLWLEVPVNASISDASLKVSGLKYKNNYPTDITINIGNDEDLDWEFRGLGYGSLGRQNLFTTGKSRHFMKFYNTSFLTTGDIMLPLNATVTSTSMNIEGGTGTYSEIYVATANYMGEVYYIESNGGGSFKPPSLVVDVGSYTYGICTADFDNDGDIDIATGSATSWSGPGNLYLIEKKGPGNDFKTPKFIGSFTGSGYTMGMAAGDYNNDGNYDFVMSGNTATIYFYAGDGAGNFTGTSLGTTGGPTRALGKDAADFNNDGNLDFVSGGSTTGTVYYYQGLGNGGFMNPVGVPATGVGSYQYSVICDDFTGNGNADILTCDWDGELYLIPGNGNGGFGTAVKTNIDAGRYSPGDSYTFDSDSKPDVVVANANWGNPGSELYFVKGMGSGTFSNTPSSLGYVGSYCYAVAAPPPRLIGAANATLDIGDMGTGYDWTYNGILEDYVASVPDFTQKLNNILGSSTKSTFTDIYGNDFVIIPLNFTSDNDGLLRIMSMGIEYTYSATIHKKGLDTIVSELNEHIVFTESDTIDLHFIITSTTSGKLKFTDLELVYNIPPDLDMNIPTIVAYEDTENLELLDLSTFFTDTDEPTLDLNYSVVYNSEFENVEVFTNGTNMLKIRPITPNWYGKTKVMIQVIDSGNKKTYSNQFKIVVQPVNDEPTNNHMISDVKMIEGGKSVTFDLSLREYFADIEEDYLYYSLVVDPKELLDPEQKEINAYIEDNSIVNIETTGDFNTETDGRNVPIPIWIYCDDDQEIDTMEDGEGTYTRQEILVTVMPVNDAPAWSSIPVVYLNEDDTDNFVDCVNLFDYLSDDESTDEELILQILSNSNPNIDVDISAGFMSIVAPEHYYGETYVTLRASETNPAFKADTSIQCIIQPVNDAPEIKITSHFDHAILSGQTTLKGWMTDVEDTVQLVEIKVDSTDSSGEGARFDWQQASIDTEGNNWTYSWDTSTVPDDYYKLIARVYDGELMTQTEINLEVNNGRNAEPVVDITTPIEDQEVSGDILIKGIVYDPDNHGIDKLQIRIGRDMDWTEIPLTERNGTINWYYAWESQDVADGPVVVSAKAYDGRSWSAPLNRKVEVYNGANATVVPKVDTTKKTEELDMLLISLLILIVVIILIGLLVLVTLVRRGNRRVKEYVPSGELEPLDQVEARLRPSLGPGVSIEHAPLPPAKVAGTAGAAAAAPSLPPSTATATTVIPTTHALPSATPVAASAQPQAIASGVPALPPAQLGQVPTVSPAPAKTDGNYGLYAPQATPAQPAFPVSAQSYQPTQPATTTTTTTAPASTNNTTTTQSKPNTDDQQ